MKKVSVVLLGLLAFSCQAFGQGLVLKYSDYDSVGQEFRYFTGGADEYSPAHYDFDNDGQTDVILKGADGIYTGILKIIGYAGAVLWESPPDFIYISGDPLFVDFDGDGNKEIVYKPGINSVSVFSPTNDECLLYADSLAPVHHKNYYVSDFDADSFPDLLLLFFEGDGVRREIWGAGTVSSSPPSNLTIRAVDGDNHLNWTKVDSCSLYNIKWSFSFDGEYVSVGTSCVPSFVHSGAAIVPRAFYQVTAFTSTWGEREVGRVAFRRGQ